MHYLRSRSKIFYSKKIMEDNPQVREFLPDIYTGPIRTSPVSHSPLTTNKGRSQDWVNGPIKGTVVDLRA